MSKEARELTTDEMKTHFLNYIHDLVDYWEHEDRAPTTKDKLEGLAFSILSTIDGDSGTSVLCVFWLSSDELFCSVELVR